MFIDFNKKFIFLKTLKTGGTSISKMIRDQYTPINDKNEFHGFKFFKENAVQIRKKANFLDSSLHTGHISIGQIKKYFINDISDYYIFSNVRNPYEVELSRILYLKKLKDIMGSNLKDLTFSHNLKRLTASYFYNNKYFFSLFIKNSRPFNFVCLDNGKDISHDYIRLENFNEDWKMICDKIDLEYHQPLHLNSNKKSYDSFELKKLFNKKNISLINKKYSTIISKNGYKVPERFQR